MKNKEATEKFRLSQRLFDEKRYAEALKVLDELVAAFPGKKNILYPRALCLYKLKRYDEARFVCDLLAERYADPRASILRERIKAWQDLPLTPDAAALETAADYRLVESMREEASLSSPTLDAPAAEDRKRILVGVAGALGVLLAIAFLAQPFFAPHEPTRPAEAARREISVQALPAATPSTPGERTEVFDVAWSTARNEFVYTESQAETSPPSVAIYYTPGSEECRKVEERVLKDPSILALMIGWRFARVNAELAPDVARGERIRAFPTVLVIDARGKEVFRREGALTATEFYTTLLELNLPILSAEEFIQNPLATAATVSFLVRLMALVPVIGLVAIVLLAGERPRTARILYGIVCAGLFAHAVVIYQINGVIAGDRCSLYTFTIPYLVLLPVTALLVALDAVLALNATFLAFVASMVALAPAWWHAMSQWPGGDDGAGMGWAYFIGASSLACILIAIPLAFLAHRASLYPEGVHYRFSVKLTSDDGNRGFGGSGLPMR